MVPKGFPALSPGSWKSSTKAMVAKAAGDMETTRELLRRVLQSAFLRGEFHPDLMWILRDGRERIEAGRYDDRWRGAIPQSVMVAGVDCSGLTPEKLRAVRSEVMTYGRNTEGAARYVRSVVEGVAHG